MMMQIKWTNERIQFLKTNYPTKGKIFCAKTLGVGEASIRQKAWELKLRQDRSSEFFKDWQKRAGESKIGKKRPNQSLVMKGLWETGKLRKPNKEQCQRISERMKALWKVKPHPRGMLGKHHTKENCMKYGERFRAMWKNPKSNCNSESHRQILSDRMFLRKFTDSRMRNGYSRGKMGTRPDLGFFVRSSWEANYARYLKWLKERGDIYDWKYEPETFWFEKIKRGTRSYLPDFKVWNTKDSEPYFVEVKGWMDEKSKTKLKRMALYYPQIKIEIVDSTEYKKLKNWSRLIPNWE